MGYKKYSDEFKRDVLAMAGEGSRSVAQLERDLGITAGLVYKWQQRYRVQADSLQLSEERAEQAELRRLRRELEVVRQERDILKKPFRCSRGGVVSRYRFIAEARTDYPVRQLCAVLQVSASGFYDWLKRDPSPRAQANAALSARIRQVHERSRQTYGYLRVHAELRANGERVGKHRIARLMRQMGLQTKGRRRFQATTQRNQRHRRAPNLLMGDFKATRRNDKWLSDITYIPTDEGWLYLAGIQDAFSRRIVGWSLSERLTKSLVCAAWRMAVGRQGTPRLHHSDQGSQYTSDDYLKLLEKADVQISMSAVGRCYDNAMQESFWGTLKTECADRPFPSRTAARRAIFEYIEIWYNRQRRHSALGYLSPAQYEQLARP